ncbi:tRNA(Ile)-lysidine synthase [Sinobacterium norvegicum]|uniref:tRNA(Ile)-lysidine synthase n=1 Tax=Sinobacterium norvegicum TaxID=1641715 RepID=A0ABM9ACL6_9GAMM|nr:tRNA lysidine(34) synthetase TilS [Sinobacterium norvegicum]CAH0990696.1 tRNA(Ile)-lysidine synthase [Sinobacterium norvegicum]
MNQLLTDDIEQQCQQLIDAPTWWVALSGGVDSVALLHSLALFLQLSPQQTKPRLVAIHINHGLSANASQWQQECADFCRQLGCDLVIERVDVINQGKGVEAEARAQRYRAIAQHLAAEDVVFTGHHLDDQVETLFLRLMRGAGLLGLQGVKRDGVVFGCRVVRLLLSVPRADIEDYACHHQLEWVDDESNNDPRFDRNFLRHQVLPLLSNRWPRYRAAVDRAVQWLSEADHALQEYSQQDLQVLAGKDRWGGYLLLSPLIEMSQVRQKTVLRYWLAGHNCRLSSAVEFDAIVAQLARVKSGAELYRGDYRLMAFADKLYLVDRNDSECVDYSYGVDCLPMTLETPGGRLVFTEPSDDVEEGLLVAAPLPLRVAGRDLGQSVRPIGRGGSRSVKKVLQEHKVPNWYRQTLPMIYAANQVVAVADCVACEHDLPADSAFVVRWQPASFSPFYES